MASASNDDDAVDLQKKARRLQELFQGRFSEREALYVIRDKQGDLIRAVDFIMRGNPGQIRQLLYQRDEAFVQDLRRDSVIIGSALKLDIPCTVRQFACASCDSSWWRKVPGRKEVSTCHRCRARYQPVPKEHEWGWAKFLCVCGNTFGGFAQMGTPSSCFHCNHKCLPNEILPPTKQSRPKTNAQHSCDAPDCFSHRTGIMGPRGLDRGQGRRWRGALPYSMRDETRCCHPRSLRESGKRVLYPSQFHQSTGSTVRTFLTQDDLKSVTCSFVSNLSVLNEDDDSGASDVADGGHDVRD